MKDQLQTIRTGIEKAHIIGGQDGIDKALAALTQLEAMVGEQEPVAWCPALTYPGHEKDRAWANGKPRKEDIEYWTLNGKGITYAYAAPVAQQPLTTLEQHDLEQWTGYRKGWEAGRIKGYEVGYRHATERAVAKAQQPQAEPLGETPTPAKNMAAPVASWDDSRTQKVYEVLTNDNYPPKGSADHWEGWKARLVVDALFPEQPQAETAQYTRADLDRAYSAGLVEGERLAIQQAEAVPSDVVRFDIGLLRELRDNCQASIAESGITPERTQYRKDLYWRASKAVAVAAIAQQKGASHE